MFTIAQATSRWHDAAVRSSVAIAVVIGLSLVSADCIAGRRGKRRAKLAPLVTTFAPNTPARAIHVIDADTVWFKIAGVGRFKGRLYGINAPECHKRQIRTREVRSAACVRDKEYFGLAAARIAEKLLTNKRVVLNCPRDKAGRCRSGRFGRILTLVNVGGRDAIAALVARGAAWTFTRYPSKNHRKLCRLEDRARKARVGMWGIGVAGVLRGMSRKTQKWYARRDAYCRGIAR